MPVKSKAQLKFMQAMAHGGKAKHGAGPSPEVAKEFISKSKGKFTKKDKK